MNNRIENYEIYLIKIIHYTNVELDTFEMAIHIRCIASTDDFAVEHVCGSKKQVCPYKFQRETILTP